MLSDSEKTSIREEEIFRAEVQSELASSRKKGIWDALNSSFVLWCLSSIVLTGIATGFTLYQDWRTQNQERVAREERIDAEIANRISSALAGVRADERRLQANKFGSPPGYYWAWGRYLDNSYITDQNGVDFSVYPEFRTRNFPSLISELRELVDAPQRDALKEHLKAYQELLTLGSVPETPPDIKAAQDTLADSTRRLRELSQPRWSGMVW